MISLQDVSVTLGTNRVVDGMNATFQPGKITAILGPNGAGKTTLLRAILGLTPHGGNITLNGASLNTLPPLTRAQRLAYLPQLAAPAWNLRCDELVMLGRAPHRLPHAAPSENDYAAVTQALADCDAMQFAARPINNLSGGERARVLLARVLATHADWLLIDEPLNHLDPLHQRNLLILLRAQAQAGKGVIVVLHDLNAAAQIADHVLLLKESRAIASGPAVETLTPSSLEQAYDMAFDVTKIPSGDLRISPHPLTLL